MGVWNSNCCSIVYLFIFAILDFVSVTVLQGHGCQFQRYFSWEVSHYDFKTSLFDLWVCSLVRTVVVLGCLFGILYNGTSSSTNRVQKIRPVIAVLATCMWAFPVIKLLCISEYRPSALDDVWFWVHFAWAVVAAIVFYANFCLLCGFKVPDVEELVNKSRVNINASDEEQRPLLAESRETDREGGKEDKEAEKMKKKKSATVWRLLSYSKPDVLYLAAAFVFMQVNAAADIFTPYYTGRVIQGITIEKSHSMFIQAIVVMSILSIVAALSAGCRGGFFKVAMSRLSIRIRNALFSAITKQEIGFFDTTVTGDITSRLTSDASTMADALGYNANIFMRNCLKAIGTCAFMFAISWRMSLQTLVALPIIMGVSSVYGEYYQSLSKQVQDSLAVANQVAEETCSSMRTVRSFANEKAEADMYANKLQVTYRLNVKEAIVYAGYAWSTMLFQLSLLVATLYYGGHLVLNDLMTGGQLIAFILYQIELGNNMNEMADVYTGLMQAVGASEKVFEIIDREPKILNDGGFKPEDLEGKLEFKDVSFVYPSRPDSTVLKNVSFNVQPGEVVALVGPSGGGKSTCINLLEHFYEAAQGQVMLDGRPVQDYDHKYLHKQISLVGQEPVLYARSVLENIAYGMETVDTEQVKSAAQLANAHQFITEMNDQYETETGEKGLQLSGGQKQRVAIARALIRNPRVLLLDEATSALDSESEHVVQEAIYGNLKGRTVVIIAHRLSTVERADRIVVIEKGSVVEQGSHTELLKSDGMYARLVRRQLLGFDVGFSDHLTRGLPPDDPVGSFKSIPETKSSVDEDSSLFGSPRYGSF